MGLRRALYDDPVFWVIVIMVISAPVSFVAAAFVHQQIAVRQCHSLGPGYELMDDGVCGRVPPPPKDSVNVR